MDNRAVVPSTGQAAGGFARLSPRTKGMLALGLAALAAVVGSVWLWSATPNYRVLFTNLSDRDGGAIIAQLAQMNIPFRNGDGGTILVPAERVHEARLKLASQGLPKGSIVGFEIMETQKFGVTQFQEQVNYQRGLEGELARSIQTLAPVASARVHLALPKQSGFLRDKQPPTASVLLQLHPGKALDRQQIAGIVHLVSSSVPELATKNVSVVDQHGNLLASERGGNGAALDAAQLDYVAQIEANTIKRIEDILEPIVGRGNVRAQVTADVDFSQVEQMAETYKPNQAADAATVRSQSTIESSQPGPAAAGGVPGALSNQPPVPPTAPINGQAAPLNPNAAAAAAAGNSTRREAVTNFEVDKNVRHTKTGSGQIRRLTAAVVVNFRMAPAAGGAAAQPTPLSEKEIQNVQALVREAMGFNAQRGDSLNVVNAPFSQPEVGAPPEAPPFWKHPDAIALAKETGKALLFLVLAMIVVFGVVRPALRAFAAAQERASLEAPPQPAQLAMNGSPGEANVSPLEQVRQLAKNDPATVANVVKAWVGNEGKA
ncbi:flagellar basal body M-ring protein FliF [Betaproteobacteria bacterium PRO7]|jgi:flagellar M-ring protein FliF|nr:flagellar basal body M-ring protein FliF [Betaproteobacteria bacterium PRO7]